MSNNLEFTYFVIKKDNGYIIPFIESFSEIEKVSAKETILGIVYNYTYYKLSIKGIRKLKLLSINDSQIKEKINNLQKLLNNSIYIRKCDKVPKSCIIIYTNHGLQLIDNTVEKKITIKKTKNISYKNRFLGKVNKKIDFHYKKINNKKAFQK